MDPSSITGPLWEMIKCCCCYLNQEAAYIYDLEENLQSLEEKWKKVKGMKKDVEAILEEEEKAGEKQRSHQVSGWLNRIERTQEEIEDIRVRRTKPIQNKCLSGCCPKNCMSSYKLGKDVAKTLKNVDELETEGERFCKAFEIALKPLHKWNEMPSGETVGLDLMFDKVWKSIEEKNVGIIGLYGMGGVGKTTLLKKINNELGKRSSAFYIMWVVASRSPSLDSIMDSIRKSVGIGDDLWTHCSNQDEKVAKIYKILKKKKFVLLLDDIWVSLDLEKVGVPHPKKTNFQSKVLFTTRFEDVCAKMEAQKKFEVKILTEKEALELFCMKVGEETLKSDPIIPKLAGEMARECKGLPLALTVVGRAMAGVKSVETWEDSKNNLRSSSRTASDVETEVFSILKFSYDQLDETHRECFLYCALYPEDYEIQVDDLIEKWIGEGFLYNNGMRSVHEMRDDGISIIDNLKLSCLLEYVEGDIFMKLSIKMHDVIRDMALWIARDQDRNKKKVIVQEDARALSQANVENWEMVERIALMNSARRANESCIQLQGITWPNLITLILKFDGGGFVAVNGLQNIQHARQLKVLELRRVKNVPAAEIGGLDLLEYLSLEIFKLTNASDFWRELKNLKKLKVLHLFLIADDDTPLGLISNLHQLKVYRLDTRVTGIDEEEEKTFQELEQSSNLGEIWVQIKSESSLNVLFKSAKLQSSIYGLEILRFQINMPSLVATMSKMKHLQRLVLEFLPTKMDPSIYDTCCLSMLRTVEILEVNTIHHLTWLKYAPLLQELSVGQCSSIEEVIKGEILEDEKDTIFPSLVELTLFKLPNLRRIHERVLSFPFLRSIMVYNCKELKKLPFDSNSANAKLRGIGGSQVWWDNLEWDDPAIKSTFQSKFRPSPY
ncbi:probable disease resistance protein At5g63020 [Neltuma alba]|uniref:probable disease resistance protein At5g63020 n=1 Tax=Neltuma alba TaxID=207710 RepID=UPI0010A412F4|nr:probable disease resistance protein At5g63020 [Prosopis alba]